MQSLYRKALELLGRGWDYNRTYAYMRNAFPRENPNDIHKALIGATAGRAVVDWMGRNEDEPLEQSWRSVPAATYRPGARYTQDQLVSIFPQVVDGPYSLDIITNISGLNQTGFQRFRVYISEGDSWGDIYQDLLDEIKDHYEFTGQLTKEIVVKFIIGYLRP